MSENDDQRDESARLHLRAGVQHKKRDLRGANLIGAKLKGADLRGTDLRESIFLCQSQVDAAQGDPATKLPLSLNRPMHFR